MLNNLLLEFVARIIKLEITVKTAHKTPHTVHEKINEIIVANKLEVTLTILQQTSQSLGYYIVKSSR